MSLPITAVGPLKVETKPILMVSAAKAGCASASAVAPASQNAVFMMSPSDFYLMTHFVREMRGFRQARPLASLKAHHPRRKAMHHNSHARAMARIIIQVR